MATINVINGGEAAMKTMLFGVPDQGLIDYINNGINRATEILGTAATGFMEKVQQVYNTYYSNEAIDNAKRLMYSMNTSAVSENVIYEVPYMGFNNTNHIMREYIMVHPKVHNMFKDNMCYGFQDQYVDTEQDFELKNKERYREVMDGVLQGTDDDSYIMYYSTDNELSMYEKFSILHTWDNIDRMIAEGYDPTDPDQEEL